jgi:hypothetical protein
MIEKQHPARPSLLEVVEREITQRTWGRIHQLQVEQQADRVVVHGCSPSYYVKQLALAAAQDVCGSQPIELDIQVAGIREPRSWLTH